VIPKVPKNQGPPENPIIVNGRRAGGGPFGAASSFYRRRKAERSTNYIVDVSKFQYRDKKYQASETQKHYEDDIQEHIQFLESYLIKYSGNFRIRKENGDLSLMYLRPEIHVRLFHNNRPQDSLLKWSHQVFSF
jgi:hypothetical protein